MSQDIRFGLKEFAERVLEHPSLPLDIRSNAGIILVSTLSLNEIRTILENGEKEEKEKNNMKKDGKEKEVDSTAGSR